MLYAVVDYEGQQMSEPLRVTVLRVWCFRASGVQGLFGVGDLVDCGSEVMSVHRNAAHGPSSKGSGFRG